MNNYKVSIIVPIYNVEKYLKRCLDSIINQTYSNLEILLIDDGSADCSGSICDNYQKKDQRIQVVHKKNEGQGMARNAGLNRATGDYVLFVDSDDAIELDMIETMLNGIDDSIDLVCCNLKIYNGIRTVYNRLINVNDIVNKDQLFDLYLKYRKIFTGPVCKLVKTSIMENIRFPNLRCNEDVYILPDIFYKCNKIKLLTDCLYIQYIRSDSTEQSKYSHNKMNLIFACDQIENFVINHYPQYVDYVRLDRIECIYHLLTTIVSCGSIEEYKDDYIALKGDFFRTYDLVFPSDKRYKLLRNNEELWIKKEKKKNKWKRFRLKIKGFLERIVN